jgi:hypothetical protein
MFTKDPRDMTTTLTQMDNFARQKNNYDQIAAVRTMAEWIAQDARFKGYAPEKLAERVQQCRSNGAALDLDDPTLRGLPRRPLDYRG